VDGSGGVSRPASGDGSDGTGAGADVAGDGGSEDAGTAGKPQPGKTNSRQTNMATNCNLFICPIIVPCGETVNAAYQQVLSKTNSDTCVIWLEPY